MSFAVDWITHENKIITFHNLDDPTLPLYQFIDPGTIDRLPTSSFYGIDEDYDRTFKSLLRRCIQQLLYHRGIQWQNEEKLFIFAPAEGDVRKEAWYGTSNAQRTVYECERNKDDPEKIWRHIHFGFRTNFKTFDGKWYVLIVPDWFVSYDGYKKSFYGEDFIKYKKRKENNQQVNTHVRFIAHFLQHHHANMFDENHVIYPFMSFGDFIQFDESPLLDDAAFLPRTEKPVEDTGVIQPELF